MTRSEAQEKTARSDRACGHWSLRNRRSRRLATTEAEQADHADQQAHQAPGSGTAAIPELWNLLPFQTLKSLTSTDPSALKSPEQNAAVAVNFAPFQMLKVADVDRAIQICIAPEIGGGKPVGGSAVGEPDGQVRVVDHPVGVKIEGRHIAAVHDRIREQVHIVTVDQGVIVEIDIYGRAWAR